MKKKEGKSLYKFKKIWNIAKKILGVFFIIVGIIVTGLAIFGWFILARDKPRKKVI